MLLPVIRLLKTQYAMYVSGILQVQRIYQCFVFGVIWANRPSTELADHEVSIEAPEGAD